MRTSGSGLESLFVCPYRLVTAVSQAAKRDKRRVRLGLRAISAILSDFHSSPTFRPAASFVPSDLCFRLGSCRNGKRAHRVLVGAMWVYCRCSADMAGCREYLPSYRFQLLDRICCSDPDAC